MTLRRIRLDALIGRAVRDDRGRTIGRIHDFGAEERGGELLVLEVHVGSQALMQRMGLSLLAVMGLSRAASPLKLPWDRLDLSDPRQPRFLGSLDD